MEKTANERPFYYEENFIPYADGAFDAKEFEEIMLGDPNFGMMSGLKAVTAKIEPYVLHHIKRKRESTMQNA